MLSQTRSAAIRKALETVFGGRVTNVIIYGSVARGRNSRDSDIDVLVVLDTPVSLGRDLYKALDALYPFTLKWGVPIHPMPAYEKEYAAGRMSFYRKIREEGVAV